MIRDFELSDMSDVVEILRANDQLRFPEVDGPEAMRRVKACDAATFLVYEVGARAVGCIRGNYDGSRAMINQLSVHPLCQKKGIGSALVREIVNRRSWRVSIIRSAMETSMAPFAPRMCPLHPD